MLATDGLLAMHAPDGLFSMPVNIVFASVVLIVLAIAVGAVRRRRDHRHVPLMGIMAAFVFAGQMVNFPIASGTTGHLLGGTLAAILLGPWAGTLVLATVIVFQALLGDGGVTVLGPNIFNMGVIGTCLAYLIYRTVVGNALHRPARVIAASFFAAWLAVVLASLFASLQLAVSGTAALTRALPAMVGTHMLIGVGEAIITACVVAFVLKTRPDLLYGCAAGAAAASLRPTRGSAATATDAAAARGRGPLLAGSETEVRPVGRPALVIGLSASLVVALFLSLLPMLWNFPDGLERVGLDKGFVLEEPEVADNGAIIKLPAYPLGVRLELVGGNVTAVHRYDQQVTPVELGDVIERIGTTPIADLNAAAAALKFDAQTRQFGVQPGKPITVVVRRGAGQQELAIAASAAPRAGAAPPLVALLPDYTVPGVKGLISTSLAGAIGTVAMFLASFAVGRMLVRPSRLAEAVAKVSQT